MKRPPAVLLPFVSVTLHGAEAVRGAVPLTDESLFEEVCKDQKEIVEAIEKLD